MQTELFGPESENSNLTVLSYGAGHDSSALLMKYIHDPVFRDTYAPGRFVVVFSDTGDEYPITYTHLNDTVELCAQHEIEFVWLKPEMGFHSESWRSLTHFFREKSAIGSKAFVKSCSDRLKIQPIYRWLEQWLSDNYGVQCDRKKGIREFAAQYGKINMMIGIAKGEERRVADPQKNPNAWYRDCINPIYPLIDLEMDRHACVEILMEHDFMTMPSNCVRCPWLSEAELEFIRRFYPDQLNEWVVMEAAKLHKHRDKEHVIATDKDGNVKYDKDGNPKTVNKNFGVFGVRPLPVMIDLVKEKYASWSDEELHMNRMMHGHCVATVY